MWKLMDYTFWKFFMQKMILKLYNFEVIFKSKNLL